MNKMIAHWFERHFSHPESTVLLILIVSAMLICATAGKILAPIVISFVLAHLMSNVVKKLQKLRCPHSLAVIVVFSLFLSLFLILLLWLLPFLWSQSVKLVTEIPIALGRSKAFIAQLQGEFPDYISAEQLDNIIIYLTNHITNFTKEILTFSLASVREIITLIVYLILVPLLVFFFLRDQKVIAKWFSGFLPEQRGVLVNIWHEMYGKLNSYIRGKIIEVVIAGLLTSLTFWLMGLNYAILLGSLFGLSVMIPYIGAFVVTIPIVATGLMQWGCNEHFFYLMLAYAAINIFDANVLVPILFSEVMNLHPLAIILAVLIFGNLFGFWGVFFAIPLAALTNVLIVLWPRIGESDDLYKI